MTHPEPFSHPLPPGDERLVALRLCEIDALITVLAFELTDVPPGFWDAETVKDMATVQAKLLSAAG